MIDASTEPSYEVIWTIEATCTTPFGVHRHVKAFDPMIVSRTSINILRHIVEEMEAELQAHSWPLSKKEGT